MHELPTRGGKVLAVVEKDQQLFVSETLDETLESGDVRSFADAEHTCDRARCRARVCVRCEVHEPDAAGPRADLTGGRFEGEPGLASTADPGQRDETVSAQESCDFVELVLAADKTRQRRRKIMALHGRGRGGELLAEDGALERSQLLARVETEALGEERARAVVRRERLRLALGVVEREHQLAPQALAERLLGNETLQLGDERSVTAERQLRIDSLLEGDEPKLVQPASLVRDDATVANVRERRAAPQRECGSQAIRREPGSAARECVAPFAVEPFEPPRVDHLSLDVEHVAGRPCEERVLTERRAQPRDVDPERAFRAPRRPALPELVDQPVARDRPPWLDEEQGEEPSLPPTTQSDRLPGAHDFHWPEHPELAGRARRRRHAAHPRAAGGVRAIHTVCPSANAHQFSAGRIVLLPPAPSQNGAACSVTGTSPP